MTRSIGLPPPPGVSDTPHSRLGIMTFRSIFMLVASLAGLACAPLYARERAPEKPVVVSNQVERQVLPPDRVKATIEAYKGWLAQMEQRNDVAGLATAVVVDDKVVYEHTMGYANAASHQPITPDTVFRLASLSKAFATAITAILIRDGKFDWDTKLSDVLPFFKLKDAQASAQASVRDIMGQRLGLPKNTYDNMLEGDVPYEELVRKLDEVDLTCGVGQCYGYQNVAFSLIGDVVYARTGEFYYRQVDKRIFLPLGMKTASYGRDALESSGSWARPHRGGPRNWIPFEPKENYYRVAPAAGVNASIRDMEQWLIAQMGGRPDVLPAQLLDVLHAPAIATPAERGSTPWRRARVTDAHYALGWRVFTYGGETLVFHAGAVEGYRTMIGFFPKYHAGVVTLWNSTGPVPAGLMPMVFDSMLDLPHVDWAGLDAPARAAAAPAKRRLGAPAPSIGSKLKAGKSARGKPAANSKKAAAAKPAATKKAGAASKKAVKTPAKKKKAGAATD